MAEIEGREKRMRLMTVNVTAVYSLPKYHWLGDVSAKEGGGSAPVWGENYAYAGDWG